MRTRYCSFLSFCAVWAILLSPMRAATDKVSYIFTGRFYVEDADPSGLHGAHFVLTSVVDADAEPSTFQDEGDYQGTAVYPSESCLTIWGAENPALNATYLPWEGTLDSITASWHSHSLFDSITFNASFLLDDGVSRQPVSMPRFYVGLNYDCILSLPCVPVIEWVYWDAYDLHGSVFSTSDVFGQSSFLRAHGPADRISLILQYVVDAVAQVYDKLDTAPLGPLWIDPDQRPVFETVDPPYYAGVTVGPVNLSVTDPHGRVVTRNMQEVPAAVYLESTFGSTGSASDMVFLFNPVPGDYQIQVVPEEGAAPEDSFSFIGIDRGLHEARVELLAGDQRIQGEPGFYYSDLVGMLDVVVSVKPGSCPKTLNLKSEGRFPVAVLGGTDFDVSEIDPASVRLNGKPAVHFSLEDVGGYSSVSSGCDEGARPDGVFDLVLHFDVAELSRVLLGSPSEESIELVITGHLKEQFGGWQFSGTDKVQLRPRRAKLVRTLTRTPHSLDDRRPAGHLPQLVP